MQFLGPPVQIAYAVNDAEEAARRWAADFGAGPFFIAPHIPVTNVIHRGRPSEFDHTSAYGQWGSVMVELVQDHGTGGTAVRDLYAPGETGLHHLAYLVDDLDEATAMLATQGFELAQSALAGKTRFHFVDAVEALGHFLELYEPSDALTGFYARVAAAAVDWDGHDAIRGR
jgi:catechol 2,3-dioxygenase-like lactoylglutathione lyase family enzyme